MVLDVLQHTRRKFEFLLVLDEGWRPHGLELNFMHILLPSLPILASQDPNNTSFILQRLLFIASTSCFPVQLHLPRSEGTFLAPIIEVILRDGDKCFFSLSNLYVTAGFSNVVLLQDI
jgi:hypothetical protein